MVMVMVTVTVMVMGMGMGMAARCVPAFHCVERTYATNERTNKRTNERTNERTNVHDALKCLAPVGRADAVAPRLAAEQQLLLVVHGLRKVRDAEAGVVVVVVVVVGGENCRVDVRICRIDETRDETVHEQVG